MFLCLLLYFTRGFGRKKRTIHVIDDDDDDFILFLAGRYETLSVTVTAVVVGSFRGRQSYVWGKKDRTSFWFWNFARPFIGDNSNMIVCGSRKTDRSAKKTEIWINGEKKIVRGQRRRKKVTGVSSNDAGGASLDIQDSVEKTSITALAYVST